MRRSPGLPVVRAVLADVTGGRLHVLACRQGPGLVLALTDDAVAVASVHAPDPGAGIRAGTGAGGSLELPYARVEGVRGRRRRLLGHGVVLVDAVEGDEGDEGDETDGQAGSGRRLSLALTVPRGVDPLVVADAVARAARRPACEASLQVAG